MLLAREEKAGKVSPLTCKELDTITGAVGLVPCNQRPHIRNALRKAGLHPGEGATGDARFIAVAAIKRSGGKRDTVGNAR
jgi:hypothetical protein